MAQQVTAHHLSRLACLYVRQSTPQQVFENTESTARQYALRERALALGWNEEHIVVIDQDLGHSGASTTDRLGFQHLVAEVGLEAVLKGLGSRGTGARMEEEEEVRTGNRECWCRKRQAMSRREYPSDISDEVWEILEPLIPLEKPGERPRTTNIRAGDQCDLVSLIEWMPVENASS
jgi:hypothetical protein